MQDETAVVNLEAEASYPGKLAKLINESGYNKQQIVSVEKTASVRRWNFTRREVKPLPGMKTSKVKLTLSSGVNALP